MSVMSLISLMNVMSVMGEMCVMSVMGRGRDTHPSHHSLHTRIRVWQGFVVQDTPTARETFDVMGSQGRALLPQTSGHVGHDRHSTVQRLLCQRVGEGTGVASCSQALFSPAGKLPRHTFSDNFHMDGRHSR